ncbi:DNA-directed RNA polymerases II 24 kDa polypeptide (RNA polymerase II subunit 5), partial [Linderina macrospora]
MDVDAREVTRLWRVYRTVHQMCSARGYLVSHRDIERDLDSFRSEFAPAGKVDRNRLTFVVQKRDDPASQMFLFFPEDKSVGIKPIKQYINKMANESVTRGIVIYR